MGAQAKNASWNVEVVVLPASAAKVPVRYPLSVVGIVDMAVSWMPREKDMEILYVLRKMEAGAGD
jgi:hypothetical protein